MNRIDLTGDSADLTNLLEPMVAGAHVVGLHSPWDDEVGYVVTDDEEFPREVCADDVVVTLRREEGQSDFSFACAIAVRFEMKVAAL